MKYKIFEITPNLIYLKVPDYLNFLPGFQYATNLFDNEMFIYNGLKKNLLSDNKIYIELLEKKDLFNEFINNKDDLKNFLSHIFIQEVIFEETIKYVSFYSYFSKKIISKFEIDFTNGNIKVFFSKSYIKYFKFNIWELETVFKILSDFLYLLLLIKGYFTLHGSAIKKTDSGVHILIGKPNTGKSLTSFRLSYSLPFIKFMGDDILIINTKNGLVYGCPFSYTFYHNPYLLQFFKEKQLISKKDYLKYSFNNLLKKIPLIYLFFYFKPDYNFIFRKLDIELKGQISKIIFLTKDIKDINNIEKDKILHFLSRIEFHWWKSNALKTLELFIGDSICNFIEKKEESAINKILDRCEFDIVYSENSMEFFEILKNKI